MRKKVTNLVLMKNRYTDLVLPHTKYWFQRRNTQMLPFWWQSTPCIVFYLIHWHFRPEMPYSSHEFKVMIYIKLPLSWPLIFFCIQSLSIKIKSLSITKRGHLKPMVLIFDLEGHCQFPLSREFGSSAFFFLQLPLSNPNLYKSPSIFINDSL